MTAKSRVRKIQKKLRRTADVNPQPGSPREASDRAEEARDAEGRAVAIALDGTARLQSVSLVREGEGTGYIIEVGENYERALEFKHGTAHLFEEALRKEATPDAAPLSERGASEPSSEPSFFEQLHEVEAIVADANRTAHLVYFEEEVNGQPTHIGSKDCYCGQELHHWKDLGEN